jgi:hypothetical protein
VQLLKRLTDLYRIEWSKGVKGESAMQKAKRLLLLAVVLGGAGLLMALLRPASASHLSGGTWSHAVNACAIDEADVSRYMVGVSFLSHRGAITGTLTARCNVENLPVTPGGDVLALQLVYRDQDGAGTAYNVSARLLAITNSGAVATIATVNSNTGPASTSFQTLIRTFSHDFNFLSNAYYVEVTVFRNDTAQAPAAAIVRIIGLIE